MHLLYMSFGNNQRHHQQAYFSIYSFLARKAQVQSINVLTDHPAFYKNIEKHLNIIFIEQNTLNDWKGPFSFFWRIKIKAIEMICKKFENEPVMYLDTDTFLYNDFGKALDISNKNLAGMHMNEGPLLNFKTKTAKRMYADLKKVSIPGKERLADYSMWNAGAVMTPNTKSAFEMELALMLCDEFCKQGVTQQFVEQYSLAVALESSYGLTPMSAFIAHYWSNKEEWNDLINQFFMTNFLQGLNEEQSLREFNELDLHKIPEGRKIKRSGTRLKKIVDDWFPDKNIVYLPKDRK